MAAYAVSKRLAHAGGDGPGDEQDVGVARRGDDAEAEPLQVDVRARRERQLVLAAVAGAGVDVAERQARPAAGRRQGGAEAEPAEVAEQRQHQRSAQA